MSNWGESSNDSPSLAGSVATGPCRDRSSKQGTTTASTGASSRTGAATAGARSYSYGDSRDVLLRLEYASDREAKVRTVL